MDKSFERNVLIERADEIVAAYLRILCGRVPFVAVRVRIVHDIHPMPGPTFAELWTIEESLHVTLVRARRFIGNKARHIFLLWREARERKT